MANVIDNAVAWAVAIANDDTHGYDQTHRQGPNYDCSSLVINAYQQAGLDVKGAGASYTGNLVNAFLKCGFTNVTSKVNLSTGAGLQKGDVIWRSGHVAMMTASNKLVEASINEKGTITGGQSGDQTGKEISVKTWYTPSKAWTKCLRYKVAGTNTGDSVSKSDIVTGNKYLTLAQMKINAQYILNYLVSRGWTKEAVCGMLGNMQTESTINPTIWQSLKEGNTEGGYGLTQWTPATKLIEWANSNNLDYTDIDAQLQRIIFEVENGIQYYSTDSYPLSFKEFIVSTSSPEYLAKAFIYNYERPASYSTAETRSEQARYWFDLLTVGANVGEGEDGATGGDKGSNKLSKLLLLAILTDRF